MLIYPKAQEKSDMTWLVYIIFTSDNSLYTGITTDIQRRWRQHCGLIAGGARYFRGRKPKQLLYVETASDRACASQREAAIKKLSHQQKLALLSSPKNISLNWEHLV